MISSKRNKMEFQDIKKDFDWVIRVLESSQNNNHLSTSIKLFEIFLNKWDWELSDERKMTLHSIFNKTKSSKHFRLNKVTQ